MSEEALIKKIQVIHVKNNILKGAPPSSCTINNNNNKKNQDGFSNAAVNNSIMYILRLPILACLGVIKEKRKQAHDKTM